MFSVCLFTGGYLSGARSSAKSSGGLPGQCQVQGGRGTCPVPGLLGYLSSARTGGGKGVP